MLRRHLWIRKLGLFQYKDRLSRHWISIINETVARPSYLYEGILSWLVYWIGPQSSGVNLIYWWHYVLYSGWIFCSHDCTCWSATHYWPDKHTEPTIEGLLIQWNPMESYIPFTHNLTGCFNYIATVVYLFHRCIHKYEICPICTLTLGYTDLYKVCNLNELSSSMRMLNKLNLTCILYTW